MHWRCTYYSMVKKLLGNPLFLSGILCAFIFYSGIASVKSRNPFKSLISEDEICAVEGFISSNPVKATGLSGSYRACFETSRVFSSTGFFSDSSGEIEVCIPKTLVESLYPGKIYTSWKKSGNDSGILFENGVRLKLYLIPSKYGDGIFSVTKAEFLGWNSEIAHFRGLCRLLFKRLMFSWGKAGGFLLALLSGSREYTEATVSTSFRDSGLSHIIALSGMHLSLFGGIAFFLGKKATCRNIADGIQLWAVLFFVWFAGLSPSLFRALLSSVILYLNSLLRMRRPEGISVLSASFLLHSVIFPEHLQEAAFMLSYLSLSGIMILSGAIKKLISPRIIPYVRSSLSESASAQIFTSPVSILIFGKLMPIGIAASIFISPLVMLFLYLGLFGIVLCLILPFLSNPFNGIMNGIYELIKIMVCFFARFPSIKVG